MKMSYTQLYKGIALASAVTAAVGCVSPGRVKSLEQEVSNVQRVYIPQLREDIKETREANKQTQSQVEGLFRKTLVEGPIMLTKGRGYDTELGMLLGIVLTKYQDTDLKKAAEKYANGVLIMPTVGGGSYLVTVVRDMDNDGQPTFYKDRKYPDKVGKEKRTAIEVPRQELPEIVREWLLNVTSVKKK